VVGGCALLQYTIQYSCFGGICICIGVGVSGSLFDFGGDLLIGCVLDSIGGVLLVQLCCQAVGAWVRWISVAVCLSSVCSKSQREVFRITLSSSRSAENE
jgi:hypothetical protein